MLSGSHKGGCTELDVIPPKTVGSPAIHPHATLACFCLCQLGEVGPLWFLRSAVAHAQNLGIWEVEAGGLSKDYSWGFIVSS